jgi:hypothetical protein
MSPCTSSRIAYLACSSPNLTNEAAVAVGPKVLTRAAMSARVRAPPPGFLPGILQPPPSSAVGENASDLVFWVSCARTSATASPLATSRNSSLNQSDRRPPRGPIAFVRPCARVGLPWVRRAASYATVRRRKPACSVMRTVALARDATPVLRKMALRCLHCVLADEEGVRDLPIRAALREECRDVALA